MGLKGQGKGRHSRWGRSEGLRSQHGNGFLTCRQREGPAPQQVLEDTRILLDLVDAALD